MSKKFDQDKYTHLINEFKRAIKRVPFHRAISSKEETLQDQKQDIVQSYNRYIEYVKTVYDGLNEQDKITVQENIDSLYTKLRQTLNQIKFEIIVPNQRFLDIINIDSIEKMTDLSKVEFLRLAGSQINKNFDGNALALQSFIDSVELLNEMATTADLKKILVTFVLTKLQGTAREAIPGTPTSLDEIKCALHSKIKPEKSKTVEGKLVALRTDRTSLSSFSDRINELAESLQRALVIEGISPNKAQEMVIQKTVEVCRTNARSDLVKAVLASSKFENHKEVVSKFLIEIDTQNHEKQIMAYRSTKFRKQNHYRNNKANNNGNKGNYHKNYYNNGHYSGNKSNNYKNKNNYKSQNGDNNRAIRCVTTD